MPISTSAISPVLAFIVLATPHMRCQDKYRESPENTYFVSCGQQPPYVSKTAQSHILISPGKSHRAYTIASAEVSSGNCVNNSKLFVQSPEKSAQYEIVFLQVPTELERGNGIRIIDWSRDGNSLLFDVLFWQYGSDAQTENEVWVYNSSSGVFSQLGIKKFYKKYGEGCMVDIEPLGFSYDGEVILKISVKQEYDEEGDKLTPLCVEKQELWSYNLSSYQVKTVSLPYRLQHWGTEFKEQQGSGH